MAKRLLGEALAFALSLDAVEAGRIGLHARAEGAAEQLVDRRLIELAGDVPQRDVDRADRGHDRAFAAVVARHVIHAVPQHFGVERIGAGDERPQRLVDDSGGDLGRLQPLRERLAPAGDAFVGYHLDQRGGALAHPALRERERLGERALEDVDGDVGDFHAGRVWTWFVGGQCHGLAAIRRGSSINRLRGVRTSRRDEEFAGGGGRRDRYRSSTGRSRSCCSISSRARRTRKRARH